MHRTFFTFAAFVTGSMMEGYPGHLVNFACKFPQLNAALLALPSRPRQILTPHRPHTLPHRSPPSRRHRPLPPSCRRSRPWDRRSRPRSRPRQTLLPHAASLVVPIISSTFFSKSAIAKFCNARQTKMAVVDSNIQHRHVTLKNHCT